MKLIVQIPCYNEAETLHRIFEGMPRSIPGIDEIEYLLIDDGCTDNTVVVARNLGIAHIVAIPGKNRRWLGRAFRTGVAEALNLGADIVVTTDGDGQYPSSLIPDLIKPLLAKQADLCIGNRFGGGPNYYSLKKTIFSKIGNWIISALTKHPTPDALSGFRAYSKRALNQLNVISNHTYTIDTLMQAHQKGLDVMWVDIYCNPPSRPSRLFRSPLDAVLRSAPNILRSFIHHQPFRVIFPVSIVLFLVGFFFFSRFVYYLAFDPLQSSGHIQSLIAGAVCVVAALQLAVLAMLGDILKVIRTLQEEVLSHIKGLPCDKKL